MDSRAPDRLVHSQPQARVSTAIRPGSNRLPEPPDPYPGTPSPINGYITPTYLAHIVIFQPSNPGIQRFIGAYEDDSLMAEATPEPMAEAVPEPGTFVFMCGGLLLISIGIFRRR